MSDTVLKIDNVSKLYQLGSVGTGTLYNDLNRWWATKILGKEDPLLKIGEVNRRDVQSSSGAVWALKDVSLDVKQGDIVGLVGKNGSGKSTLLKIISRITSPTTGIIKARGRVASLLEVGTGFHDDLTGRENIYMNGAILGMSRREITAHLDEIIEFSSIARYIDTPVKRYSSGMKVRLGFAVAAFLNPEILLVDEVLAVGDQEFQKRAIGKIKSITGESGRTVLFVSHNLNSVQMLCNRGVLLEDGMVRMQGSSEEVVKEYLENFGINSTFDGIDGSPASMYLTHARVWSEDAGTDGIFTTDKSIFIEFDVTLVQKLYSFCIGFNVFSSLGTPIARSDFNDSNQITTLDSGKYRFFFEIPPHSLANGNYQIVFDLAINRRRLSTEKSNLQFDVVFGNDSFGKSYSGTSHRLSSLIRTEWARGFEKIS